MILGLVYHTLRFGKRQSGFMDMEAVDEILFIWKLHPVHLIWVHGESWRGMMGTRTRDALVQAFSQPVPPEFSLNSVCGHGFWFGQDEYAIKKIVLLYQKIWYYISSMPYCKLLRSQCPRKPDTDVGGHCHDCSESEIAVREEIV